MEITENELVIEDDNKVRKNYSINLTYTRLKQNYLKIKLNHEYELKSISVNDKSISILKEK